MRNVHFKRHGFGDWLELNVNNFHVDMREDSLHISIEEEYKEVELWQGKEYTVSKSRRVLTKDYSTFDFKQIESDINSVVNDKIKLDCFIESYNIGCEKRPNDIDMIHGNIILDDLKCKDCPFVVSYIKETYKRITTDNLFVLRGHVAQNETVRELVSFIHKNIHKNNFDEILLEKYNCEY